MKKVKEKKFSLVWTKILIGVKEVGNVITNMLCPLTSILVVIATMFQLPIGVVKALKTAEEWLWKASGTATAVEEAIKKQEEKEKGEN